MAGAFEQSYESVKDLLRAATDDIDELVRLKSYGVAGIFAQQLADYENAHRYFQLAIELADRLDRPLAKANAYANLGNVESFLGNYARAEGLHQAAIAIYGNLPEERSIATFLGHLACNATRARDIDRAIAYADQAIEAFRAIGDKYNLAVALANSAETYILKGSGRESVAAILEALAISGELKAWRIVAECHALLLMVAVELKAWNAAANLAGMHRTLHFGRELPLTKPGLPNFVSLRQQTEAAMDARQYSDGVRLAAQFDPGQCIDAMQSVCANLRYNVADDAHANLQQRSASSTGAGDLSARNSRAETGYGPTWPRTYPITSSVLSSI